MEVGYRFDLTKILLFSFFFAKAVNLLCSKLLNF